MMDKLTPKVVAALGAAAVAAVALIGWFGLVSPQRSKAAELDSRIADAKTQLVVLKARTPSGARAARPRSVLTRAMPRSVAMSTVLRQLLRAARHADVRLDSLTPLAATAQAGYSTVPMDVVVTGRYFASPAVPEATCARRRASRARACTPPAGCSASTRSAWPPARISCRSSRRRSTSTSSRTAVRPAAAAPTDPPTAESRRPRSRRLPQEGHPDDRYRDTRSAAAGRPPATPRKRARRSSSPPSRSCSSRCSPSSCPRS